MGNDKHVMTAIFCNGKLTLQRREYIEDGWYIEQNGAYWKLFEIPWGGGEPQEVGNYDSIGSAIQRAQELI